MSDDNKIFEVIREITSQLGISTPESNERIYDINLFKKIKRRVSNLYEMANSDASKIVQLEQEVKELKDYIQKLQVEHVESISKERKRWAREDLDALAQHDKELTESAIVNFCCYIIDNGELIPEEVLQKIASDFLQQLQQGGE